MKKNIIKSTMIAAVAIFAGYNVYQANVKTEELSDIMMANVEALAQNESGSKDYPDRYPLTMKCGVMIDDGWLWDTTCQVTIITCQGGGSGCTSAPCPVHPR